MRNVSARSPLVFCLAAVALVALALPACKKNKQKGRGAEHGDPSQVVAKVDDSVITRRRRAGADQQAVAVRARALHHHRQEEGVPGQPDPLRGDGQRGREARLRQGSRGHAGDEAADDLEVPAEGLRIEAEGRGRPRRRRREVLQGAPGRVQPEGRGPRQRDRGQGQGQGRQGVRRGEGAAQGGGRGGDQKGFRDLVTKYCEDDESKQRAAATWRSSTRTSTRLSEADRRGGLQAGRGRRLAAPSRPTRAGSCCG